MNKLRGLSFSDQMVGRLLDGSKTMTRRLRAPTWLLVRVSDRFYVREALVQLAGKRAGFALDGTPVCDSEGAPLPWLWEAKSMAAMYMPKRYARMELTVTSVATEQLQAISEAEAVREGFQAGATWSAVAGFAAYWDTLHEPQQHWAHNPTVIALGFTVERVTPVAL